MKTMTVEELAIENLNYLIMLISQGEDVGVSLEEIIVELNRRIQDWRNSNKEVA